LTIPLRFYWTRKFHQTEYGIASLLFPMPWKNFGMLLDIYNDERFNRRRYRELWLRIRKRKSKAASLNLQEHEDSDPKPED